MRDSEIEREGKREIRRENHLSAEKIEYDESVGTKENANNPLRV